MLRLQTVLDVVFDKVTKEDWDNVLVLGGDEGIGKSNLGLHISDYWNTKLYGSIKPVLIKNVCLSLDQFLLAFKDLKQFELIIYDEAGELSSLRMMTKFNFAITQAYEVVRGQNLFTILILPDVFYLNPFFSNRRARGYIHVYKRGRFAYWDKKRLRALIEKNKHFKRRSVWRVPPLFYDTFPKYKGVLKEPYLEKKTEKMNKIRDELYDKLMTVPEEKFNFLKYIFNAHESRGKKLTVDLIGEIFEMSGRHVYRKKEEYIESVKKEAEGKTTTA